VRLAKPACPRAHMMVRHFTGWFWWDLSSSRNWGDRWGGHDGIGQSTRSITEPTQ
jgi:hypothetical protein